MPPANNIELHENNEYVGLLLSFTLNDPYLEKPIRKRKISKPKVPYMKKLSK